MSGLLGTCAFDGGHTPTSSSSRVGFRCCVSPDDDFDSDGWNTASDCDDTDADVNPGEAEVCNGIDDNCDDEIDEGFDTDGDGWPSCNDCNEALTSIHPCQHDPRGDGTDQDCDGDPDTTSNTDLLGNNCLYFDDFEGTSLAAHWDTTAVGTPPTYTVSGSWLRVTDAAFAATPSSSSGNSWIFEPNTDLGNQMTWSQSIGTDDFNINFDFGWSSSTSELTLAGVGLTNSSDQLEVYAGISDGGADRYGNPYVRVRRTGDDDIWEGSSSASGTGNFEVTRTAGALTVSFDGSTILSTTSGANITAVVIFSVRHRSSERSYTFGTFELDHIDLWY